MDLPVTIAIIAITCLASFPAFSSEKLKDDLLFWPYQINKRKQFYRFITGGFLHADTVHLIFNMISLYSFGAALENFLFPKLFGQMSVLLYVVLYLSGIIVACIPDYFKYKDYYGYRALGASGAVSAIVFAAIIIEPTSTLRFLFIPFDIPAYIFGLIFLGLSAYLARKGQGNVGHNAHFWGGIWGVVFTWLAARSFAHKDLFKDFLEKVF